MTLLSCTSPRGRSGAAAGLPLPWAAGRRTVPGMAGGLGTGWGAPPRWAWVVMVVGVVALLVLTPLAVRRGTVPAAEPGPVAGPGTTSAAPTSSAATSTSAAVEGTSVEVAVLGGSYVGTDAATDWPQVLGTQNGWEVTSFAADGSGFVADEESVTAIGARVDRVVAAEPDVVVLVGGRDDVEQPPSVVQEAAQDVLTRLRAGLPEATVLVVGVLWAGEPVGFLTTIDNALRGVAARAGVPFADARGEGWLDGGDEPLTTPDGGQLTEAGEQVVAERVGSALITAGVPAG